MQQTQENYRRIKVAILIVLSAIMAAGTASYAGITGQAAPDPLLYGASKGPCDPKLDQPDYVAGTDVGGHPVAPADLGRAKVPVPGEIMAPLPNQAGKEGGMVALNGKALDPLLNPKPACAR